MDPLPSKDSNRVWNRTEQTERKGSVWLCKHCCLYPSNWFIWSSTMDHGKGLSLLHQGGSHRLDTGVQLTGIKHAFHHFSGNYWKWLNSSLLQGLLKTEMGKVIKWNYQLTAQSIYEPHCTAWKRQNLFHLLVAKKVIYIGKKSIILQNKTLFNTINDAHHGQSLRCYIALRTEGWTKEAQSHTPMNTLDFSN